MMTAKESRAREKRKAEIRAVKARLLINYAEVGLALEPPVTKQMVGAVAALKFTSRRVVEALVARGMPAKLFAPEYPGIGGGVRAGTPAPSDAGATASPSPRPGRTQGSPLRERGRERGRAA